MEKRPYPKLDNGRPVPVEELELPPSRLNLRKLGNFSLHHYWYNAPWYRQDFIFNSMRNLKGEHVLMPKDQHNQGKPNLHTIYGEIERPTYQFAMDRLEEAFEIEEPFEVWDKKQGYIDIEFDRACWEALKNYYDSIREPNPKRVFDMAAD